MCVQAWPLKLFLITYTFIYLHVTTLSSQKYRIPLELDLQMVVILCCGCHEQKFGPPEEQYTLHW